ncbi:hypothetical protein [Prosthecobacter vanneervenii]|uniref:TraB/GumN family protein n=1 Tax=Prosthecobacter vanneervenii TaxID=48466 RepID=A0A7W8DMU4_9BACT|nr:hypothetical protein [Prosthecobacter vanneervenii]MBB5035420.1 hypothetical protein [Prosthecobacter vanneervenii]
MKKLLLLPAVLAFTTLHAAAAEEPTNFIRFVEEAKTDSLQTAVMSYESPQKVKVDLVGAIHIADKAYFEGLNLRFKKYDAVLYELVGPAFEDRDDPEVKQEASKIQWVGQLQTMMRDALKLHGQLEGIDYRATNFVHADMDLSQFSDTQTRKQESFFSLYLKAMKAQEAANEKRGGSSTASGFASFLKVFTVKDSSTELKRMIAREFDSVEDIMAGIESGDGTVIVGERNKFALRVLDNEIAIGKKNLAIFYGAAHLGDMEQRLLKKGYTRTAVSWLKAWDLPHAE